MKRSSYLTVASGEIEGVREALISWFRKNGRDLPWRRTRDPYRILVSEVMLQQIRVNRAVPFYEAFLERFPTLRALAGSPVAEAIHVWGDLGRYRRVVSLHRTARTVVEEYGGEIPSDPQTLVKLPGIGPYTAGAVSCFAFEKDVAFADTNIRRALRRIFFGSQAPGSEPGEKGLLDLATRLVPPGRGWEWNQALMELGAMRCTARKPACGGCPVRSFCRAHPHIAETLEATPRVSGRGAAYRYEDSNRYYRGRVLAQLRASYASGDPEGVDLRELGRRIREGFTEDDLPWLRGVVESLKKDGLASVAEEKAPYGADERSASTRVRLP